MKYIPLALLIVLTSACASRVASNAKTYTQNELIKTKAFSWEVQNEATYEYRRMTNLNADIRRFKSIERAEAENFLPDFGNRWACESRAKPKRVFAKKPTNRGQRFYSTPQHNDEYRRPRGCSAYSSDTTGAPAYFWNR